MVRILASLAAAALYALALPPFGWTVLGWLTLVPLLLAVRDRSSRAAFGHGLLFGTAGSARSTRHPHPSFEAKRWGRTVQPNLAQSAAAAKSP